MKSRSDAALILGVSGQDGAYLARLLLERGMDVHGTSRDKEISSFANLRSLGIYDLVKLHSAVVSNFRSVLKSSRPYSHGTSSIWLRSLL
jgi:GDPmannose 4,6-dehydratase